MINRIAIALCALFYIPVYAETLSKEALYYRCYSQITGMRPLDTDPLLAGFRNGTGDPIAECLAILDSAKLSSGGALITDSDLSTKVLAHMHAVHSDFFENRTFSAPAVNDTQTTVISDLIDPSTPALFITRALFGPSVKADSIITGKQYLLPLRTNNDPTSSVRTNAAKTIYGFNFFPENLFKLAPIGLLKGISVEPVKDMKSFKDAAAKTANDLTKYVSVRWGDSEGGGFIGTHAYLMKTVDQDTTFVSDLAGMPRRWVKAVLHDSLCRSLPTIRITDGDSFVVPNSALAFRTSRNCTHCHATMDRMGSTLRNFTYFGAGFQQFYHQGTQHKMPMHYKINAVTMTSEAGWPAAVDADYYKRPPRGTLYFRTASDGSLVDIPINNIEELGQKISEQDDFYICLANRYWNYFTNKGIKMEDQQIIQGYSPVEQARFTKIKNWGIALKARSDQSLRWLIEQILRSPEYADSAFGQ